MDAGARLHAEHQPFQLTAEPAVRPTAVRAIRNLQVGLGIIWVLLEPTVWCGYWSGWPLFWLPVNYLLFDLYLLIRDRHGLRWRKASRAIRGFVWASPFTMVASTLVLGLVGSWIYERL